MEYQAPPKPDNPVKIWLTAVRPFAYSASVTAVLLGFAVAFYEGYPVLWGRLFITLFGVVAFHTAANLLNDRYDFERGLDKQVLPMSGAVVRGWLTPEQVTRAAVGLIVFGSLCGLWLAWVAGWTVLALGALGAIIVLFYTRSGFCLKYTALGDLAIFLTFGILPVLGTYWVQTESIGIRPVLWSLPLVAYTVGILHANNWHDLESDPKSGCRTVASNLGDRRSSVYYRILMLGPFIMVAIYMLAGLTVFPALRSPFTLFAVLLVLPKALKLIRINRETDFQSFMMLDGLTAQMQMGFGLLLAVAFIVGRYLA